MEKFDTLKQQSLVTSDGARFCQPTFKEAVKLLNEVERIYEEIEGPRDNWKEEFRNNVDTNRNELLTLYHETIKVKKSKLNINTEVYRRLRYDVVRDKLNQIEYNYEQIKGLMETWDQSFKDRVNYNRMTAIVDSCRDMDDVRLPYTD